MRMNEINFDIDEINIYYIHADFANGDKSVNCRYSSDVLNVGDNGHDGRDQTEYKKDNDDVDCAKDIKR